MKSGRVKRSVPEASSQRHRGEEEEEEACFFRTGIINGGRHPSLSSSMYE